jgi:hypothetical protein
MSKHYSSTQYRLLGFFLYIICIFYRGCSLWQLVVLGFGGVGAIIAAGHNGFCLFGGGGCFFGGYLSIA